MTQPAKGQEPSMEEILASIRRIIADEDSADSAAHAGAAPDAPPPRTASPPPRTAPLPPEPVAREEEIDSMLARLQAGPRQAPPSQEQPVASERTAEHAPAARRVEDRHEDAFETRSPEHHAARAAETPRAAADDGERGLMSAATTAAVDAAFNALAQNTLAQNALAQAARARDGRTLEDVVSDLVRPMLKAWLDDNLPDMVERLVRAEIERISRRSE